MSNLRDKLFPKSVLKEHERGLRRYYPLGDDKDKHSVPEYEAMEILMGKPIEEIPNVTWFVCDPEKYIEEFDGKFWVRTTDTREGVKEYEVVLQANNLSFHTVEARSEEQAIRIAKDEAREEGQEADWVIETIEEA
tara:strand:- start:230 stop:637 length:408 start_codon:yes stop_codon:yes gene_type:complete